MCHATNLQHYGFQWASRRRGLRPQEQVQRPLCLTIESVAVPAKYKHNGERDSLAKCQSQRSEEPCPIEPPGSMLPAYGSADELRQTAPGIYWKSEWILESTL